MKEQMTYVAIDADDVGESIGGAVLSDDADKLSALSGNINAGVQIFSKWAEYNGGKVISSGSDEAIFQVPIVSIDQLEDLKNRYQEKTGFSVSVGIGEKISEAAKALIYAKVNGKNQIIDYSPEIEEAMKQSISGKLDQLDSGIDEQKLVGGVGDETPESDVDEEQLEMGKETEKEHTSDKGVAKEIAMDHLTEDPEYYSKLKEVEGDEQEPEQEAEAEEDEEEDEEADKVLENFDEDESNEDEKLENIDDDEEDLDVDGRPDIEEDHGKIDPEKDDIDGDGDVEHEEAIASREGKEDEYSDTGDEEDEYLEEEPEAEDEEGLADAIEAEMEDESEDESEEPEAEAEESEEEMPEEAGEESESEEEMPEEEMSDEDEMDEEQEITDESLKQSIFDSLQIFKQNRDLLNALATENPDLHNALVVSLQAMIEMAKELGFGNAIGQEDEEELNPEDFEVSEEPEEDTSEEPEAPEENKDMDKSEAFGRLVNKINSLNLTKNEQKKKLLLKLKEKLKEIKAKSDSKKDKKPSFGDDQKKKKPKPKKVEAASFCANSNQKMKTSGADCRSNDDKDSPVCVARKKMNCRGKNAEKGPAIQKSEKLKNFLDKKRKK